MSYEELGTDEALDAALSYEEWGTDEALESALDQFGTDELLDMASMATDEALSRADNAIEGLWDAASSGLGSAVDAATGLAGRALGGLSTLLLTHKDLLVKLVEHGLATYQVYQRLQSEVQVAKAKKGELEQQLAAMLSGRIPGPGGSGSGTTITVTSPGGGTGSGIPSSAAGTPAATNYAAYGLVVLGAAALAWLLARR